MEKLITEALNKGVDMHVSGEFDLAAQLYESVIKLEPNHADANHNMGLLKLDIGSDLEALPYLQTALQADTGIAQFWQSYILALIKVKRIEEANRILALAIESSCDAEGFIKLQEQLDTLTEAAVNTMKEINPSSQGELNILDTLTLSKALNLAKKNLKEGAVADARLIYLDILKKFPKNIKARQGLDGLSTPPEDSVNQLIYLYNQRKLLAVVEQAHLILQKYPRAFEVWNILGVVFRCQGKLDEAIRAFDQALRIKPDYSDAFNNQGACFQDQGNFKESIVAFNNALSIRPDYAEALYNKGSSFQYQDILDEAIEAYSKALSIEPNYAQALNNMGLALNKQGRFDEAMEAYNSALSIQPDYAEVYNNSGVSLQDEGKLEEAIEAFNKALSIKPDYAEAHNNIGLAFQDQGNLEMAMKAFKKAISLKPNFADAYNNLGKLHWLQHDFIRAFDLMEWRWQKKDFSIGCRLNSTHPTWNGEDKKNLFVWKEQGIGDEIMFSSLLIDANSRSEKLVVECDKRLIPLYKRSFPKRIKFVDHRDKVSDNLYDTQIAIGSLPKHFRHKLSDFAIASAGWLKSDPQKTSALREKLKSSQNNKIIGISWFTKSSDARYKNRNIPIGLLARYLKKIPAKYVNLQYGETTKELSEIQSTFGLGVTQIKDLDLFNNIEGLAALISSCDIVISIDNSTVHLAGALGIDTRVLLPFSSDDRWGFNRSDCYWYESLTLYRQEVREDWSKPLEDLSTELSNIVCKR